NRKRVGGGYAPDWLSVRHWSATARKQHQYRAFQKSVSAEHSAQRDARHERHARRFRQPWSTANLSAFGAAYGCRTLHHVAAAQRQPVPDVLRRSGRDNKGV